MTRRRLHAFVEALTGNRRTGARRASPGDIDAMRMAIELRASNVEDATVRPEFVGDLHQRLARQLRGVDGAGGVDEGQVPEPNPRFSRRVLLEVAGVAAAAGAAVAVDRTAFGPAAAPTHPAAASKLVPDSGTWHTVAARAALQDGVPARFESGGTVGFVTDDGGVLRAVSGVCTHQGCLLQANDGAGRLDCPCHRAAFSPAGQVLFAELADTPPPLPQLTTRVRDGVVQVLVPRSA